MAKKQICLYFQVHQPARLRLYRFFDIGKDSHYYDDFANRNIIRRLAQKCYLPMNELLLDLIKTHGDAFKVSFSISGSAIEQFDRYAPEVLDSFRALAKTGNVEFLAETYYHSLASLANPAEFRLQVEKHKETIESLFGQTPVTFRNTELIYDDGIGEQVAALGFKTLLTEGAKNMLGWQSPNFVYSAASAPKLKLLLRNYSLSDDIAVRFSNRSWDAWPLTADKYLGWVKSAVSDGGNVVGLFMDYETFGEVHKPESGILDFFKAFVGETVADGEFEFSTPASIARRFKATGDLAVPETVSWSGFESDVTSWLGNELQNDAFNKLYSLYEKLAILNQPSMWNDFGHLQESDHLYCMSTKFFGDVESKRDNPYDTPYEAFINFMNVLSDFSIRVDDALLTLTRPAEEEAKVKKAPARKSASKAAKAAKPAKKTAAKKK